MNRVLKLFFSMSLSGTLLILALTIARPLYKNRTGRRWQYYIWLIVIARLLLPFSPRESFSGTLVERLWPESGIGTETALDNKKGESPSKNTGGLGYGKSEAAARGQNGFAGDDEGQGLSDNNEGQGLTDDSNRLGLEKEVVLNEKADSNKKELVFSHLWMLWIGVAGMLFVRKVTVYQSFVKYIKAGREEVVDVGLLDALARAGAQAGVKRPVELYVNKMVSSPLLTGFFRPCIVLPSANLPDTYFQYTVWHELSHYKRLDMFYKWLVQLAVCIHWFNPFVWMMGRQVGRDCELACDEAVICRLDREGRIAYGDTLLDALRPEGSGNHNVPAVMLSEDAKQLKERLWMIMNFKKRTKLTVLLSGVLTAALFAGAAKAGAAVIETGDGKPAGNPIAAEMEKQGHPAALSDEKPSMSSMEKKAEKYYKAGNLPGFSEVFDGLDEAAQKTWMEKIYKDDEIAFFSAGLNWLEEDSALVDAFAKKAYRDERLNYFSVLTGYMDRSALKSWLKKAEKDRRTKYRILLLEDLDMDGEAEALEKKLEQEQEKKDNAEYKEFGITVNGKSYYYKGKLVRIFIDIRKEGSFYVLERNPKGTIDIVVKRDADGKIKKVRRMSAAERKGLFGEDEDNEKDEKQEKEKAGQKDKVDEALTKAGGVKVTAPVSLKKVKDGEFAWIGTYHLSENDKVYYKVSAKGGKRICVGFAKPGDDNPNTTYVTVCNERQDGKLEAVCGPYIWKSPLKPGKYRLFVHAKGADLKKVEGAAVIVKKESE